MRQFNFTVNSVLLGIDGHPSVDRRLLIGVVLLIQIESHISGHLSTLLDVIRDVDVALQGYDPLGGGERHSRLLGVDVEAVLVLAVLLALEVDVDGVIENGVLAVGDRLETELVSQAEFPQVHVDLQLMVEGLDICKTLIVVLEVKVAFTNGHTVSYFWTDNRQNTNKIMKLQ